MNAPTIHRFAGFLQLTLLALLLATPAALATPGSHQTDDRAGPNDRDDRDDRDAKPTIPSVNLNTASVEDLCTLPGVGRKKAEAILALRKTRPYLRVSQLLEVRGIGAKTLKRLKPYLRVADAPTHPPTHPPTTPPNRP